MTTNFILLNKLTVTDMHILLILATAASLLYVLANFIAIVANAISVNQN